MRDKITKLVNVYKKYGFRGFVKKCYRYFVANYLDKVSLLVFINPYRYHKIIREILNGKYERIILWRSSFGYNVPLFQRPQHIANNLVKNNSLIFYEVTTMTDKVKTISKKQENLYLFNFNNILLNRILMKELAKINKPKYIQLYCTDWKLTVANIEDYLSKGFKLIYEYVDHLSADLAGTKEIPKNILEKFAYVISNKDVYIIVTAEELKKDIEKRRGNKNLGYSTNGVDYEFFQKWEDYELEKDYLDIINNGKINLCYYGALAKWFDYDLIKKIAKTNKYNIIFFGLKYDESYDLNKMDEVKNVYFLGSKDYQVLKYYAIKCDILMIPFLLNDITKSTSPVKIFEYMAMKKPIVTTDLLECHKYESVLIGQDHNDFLKKLEEAYKLKDDSKYHKLLQKEAKENDWSKKAKIIIDLIKKDE